MPRALITGASTGIGRELARVLARSGYDLVVVARDEARLRELAGQLSGVRVQVIAADLTDATAPRRIFEAAGPIDVLVNNAGFGVYGELAKTPLEENLRLVQVNVAALVALTRLFLPDMLAARGGRILNVASTAAFQPGPLMASYYASKAFVLSFSEAVAVEVEGTGVTVTTLCPGPTTTEFFGRAKMDRSGLATRLKAMDARTVAEIGYRGMQAGKMLVIPGWTNRLLAFSTRLGPRKLQARIVKRIQSSK